PFVPSCLRAFVPEFLLFPSVPAFSPPPPGPAPNSRSRPRPGGSYSGCPRQVRPLHVDRAVSPRHRFAAPPDRAARPCRCLLIPAAELKNLPPGRWVKVAGLVLIRQRPGTAAGIVFVTLEDETGVANLILRPEIYDRHRPAARHAMLLQADGYLERQGQVIHVM